jgi:hypothetical protein
MAFRFNPLRKKKHKQQAEAPPPVPAASKFERKILLQFGMTFRSFLHILYRVHSKPPLRPFLTQTLLFMYQQKPPQPTGGGTAQEEKTADAVEREKMINIHTRVKQRENVFAQPLDLTENFVTPSYPKPEVSVKFIDDALADNFIFSSLSKSERRQLIDAMQPQAVPAGTIIIQQGDIGDYFYVVEDGHISFAVDGNHVGDCTRGASFGELALLYNCPRAATCLANTDCRLWKVDQRTFRYMLANNTANQQKDINDTLRKSAISVRVGR